MDELSPEESERFFERLERELVARSSRLGRANARSSSGRQPPVRVGADEGGGRYERVTTAGCADLSELQVTLRDYGRRCGRRSSRRRQVGPAP
jgi:hypothetical protein